MDLRSSKLQVQMKSSMTLYITTSEAVTVDGDTFISSPLPPYAQRGLSSAVQWVFDHK